MARRLLEDGWHVRGLTRDADSKQAQALRALGADVAQGDMAEAASLRPVFEGAYGVYSVQNPFIGGPEQEIRQGKNVADVAKDVDVEHLVYGSAGTGRKGTGVPSWETKLQIEAHMKALGLPLTILRPTAFMELMTHKKFFPPVAAWQVMPKLMGPSRRLPWLCTEDLGVIGARAFANPHSFVGTDLTLASDVRSLEECRSTYREVIGRNPQRLPMPVWLFEAVRAFRVRGQGFDHDVALAANGPRRFGYLTDARYPSGCADGRRLAEQAQGGGVVLRVERLVGTARSFVDAHRVALSIAQKVSQSCTSRSLFQRSAWKGDSPKLNFRFTEF